MLIEANALLTVLNNRLKEKERIRFKKPVHGIFTGACANQHFSYPIPSFQVAAFEIRATDPVIALGECCGQYSPEMQRDIYAKVPGVPWVFPSSSQFTLGAPNLHQAEDIELYAEQVADWLIATGYAERISTATPLSRAPV